MPNPKVCAVLLTSDRQAMTERAVRCFISQQYDNKSLLIFDNGSTAFWPSQSSLRSYAMQQVCFGRTDESIGEMRNIANGSTPRDADILMHWDSDDWSHPFRMAEQVAELESSQRDVTGYTNLLFWDARKQASWLYSNGGFGSRMPGTTLAYWRRSWMQRPFPDRDIAEDWHWLEGGLSTKAAEYLGSPRMVPPQPRMIAEIHADSANAKSTTGPIDPELMITAEEVNGRKCRNWKRTPNWVEYCRERMAL